MRTGKQAVEVVMLHVLFQRWVWEILHPGMGERGAVSIADHVDAVATQQGPWQPNY